MGWYLCGQEPPKVLSPGAASGVRASPVHPVSVGEAVPFSTRPRPVGDPRPNCTHELSGSLRPKLFPTLLVLAYTLCRSHVLKCRFYYHSGAVRPSDQETVTTAKIVARHCQEGPPPHTGPHGEAPGRSGGRGRKCGQEPLLWLNRREWAGLGKQAWEWLVRIISGGSGAQGCPSLSGTGPGGVRTGGQTVLRVTAL